MNQEQVRQLIESFEGIGQAKFRPSDFSNPREPNPAHIEVILDVRTSKCLESWLTERVRPDAGYLTKIQIEQGRQIRDNQYQYKIKIVPENFAAQHLWEQATEDTIKKLIKVIENYALAHHSKYRRLTG